MAEVALEILYWLALATGLAACGYAAAALIAVRRFREERKAPAVSGSRPSVTVLKPVCGLDCELYENLRSFCEQDYPTYQVVFGARSADDPAVAVARQIISELPGRDLALVVDTAVHGANLKVSNLINSMQAAKHDLLVIADSDMRVEPGYLSAVAAPFDDARIGAVTCLYRGVARGGPLSRLACLHINEWFLPSVLVARMLPDVRFCFGATMAVRRDILARRGGFESLADVLADDYMIGQYARDEGHRVALSTYVVDNVVREASFPALLRQELRWARTNRVLSPGGHRFSFLIDTISVALAAFAVIWLAGDGGIGLAVLGLAVALRLALHRLVTSALSVLEPAPFWMIPLRDMTSFAVWLASFLGRGVRWRGARLVVAANGDIAAANRLEPTST